MMTLLNNPRTKPFHLSIRGRLWLAFLFVSGMTILAALVALLSFTNVSQTLRGISEERVPAMISLSQLAQRSNTLLAAASGILFAEHDEELAVRAQSIGDAEAALGDALRAVTAYPGMDQSLEEITHNAGRISAQVQILISLVEYALETDRRTSILSEQIQIIDQEYRLLLPNASASEVEVLDVLTEANTVLGLLTQVQRARSSVELNGIAHRISIHLDAAFAAQSRVGNTTLRNNLQDFLRHLELVAINEGNIVDLRQNYLWTAAVADARLKDIHDLTGELDSTVTQLLRDAEADIVADRMRTENDNANTLLLLLLTSIITVVSSVLIAWRYVGHGILDRIAALRASMQAIAAGDFTGSVPTDGHDEVTEMGETLVFFRNAVADVSSANDRARTARRQLTNAIESIEEGFAWFNADDSLILTNHKFETVLPVSRDARAARWSLSTLVERSLRSGRIKGGTGDKWDNPGAWESAKTAFEIQLSDRSWHVVSPRRTGDGGTVVVLTEVSDLKDREEQERRTAALLAATFNAIDQGLAVFDKDLQLRASNARYQQMFSLPDHLIRPGASLGEIWKHVATSETLMSHDDSDGRKKMLEEGKLPTLEEARQSDGTVIDIHRNKMPDGGFVSTYTDVTVDRERLDRIRFLATHDSLTGLPNQIALKNDIESHFDASRPAGLIYLNLNGFREVNETFGRTLGDAYLRTVADRLKSVTSENGTAYRLGGDDFVALIANCDEKPNLRKHTREIMKKLGVTLEINGLDIDLSPYAGLSRFPRDGATSVELLQTAQMALSAARTGQAGSFRFYDKAMGRETKRRQFLRSGLRDALRRDEIIPYYQPKIDLQSGHVTGMEALARWDHHEDGMISPGEFIPVAEATGQILSIGHRILNTACMDAARWIQEGYGPLRVAINVSPVQLLGQDFTATVNEALENAGLEPHLLELEITEGVVMQEDEKVLARLSLLRNLGVHIAIDDFGTGYSSLSYFKRLPVTAVKIDQSFVKQLHRDPDDAVLAKAVIGLAQDFGLETVAEGVEHPAHLTFLKEEGCTFAQGYLIAKPMRQKDFQSFLKKHQSRSGKSVLEASHA